MRFARIPAPQAPHPPVPREIARSGSTTDLYEQFVLARSLEAPEGFQTDALGSWTLAYHPTLPVVTMRARGPGNPATGDGRIGWLVGYPITAEGRLLGAGSTVSVTTADDPIGFVDSLGGRFLAMFVDGSMPAIYPDAAGTYSSVFSPGLEIAASTPGLIPYDESTGDRLELVEQLGIPYTNSMYPLGLTPRHGVRQLLPNHHLELNSWTMVRHGPRWRERGSIDVDESVSRIAEIVKRNVSAVMDAFPCYLQLTAGNDSRMVLACAREHRSRLTTYTLRIRDLDGRNDAQVAARISEQIGVQHLTVPIPDAKRADLDRWVYQTACSVGEPRGRQASTALRSLDPSRVHLAGNIGECARNQYWPTGALPDTAGTTDTFALYALVHLAGHLGPGQQRAAMSSTVLDEIERWKSTAGAPDALGLLDLLYVENRLGCWAGIWPYAQYYGPGFTLFPMCHREVIDLMLSLPEDVRRDGTFNQMVIRQEWPELLDVPFNTPSRSVRAAHFPTRVAGGLRRRARDLRRRTAP